MSGFLDLARLFGRPEDQEALTDQVVVLRTMLINAIQEIEVLKGALREQRLWNEELHRRLRIQRMVDDHSGAGAAPWRAYSWYAYTLDEEEFLRHRFNVSDDDLTRYRREVEFIRQLS